MNNNKLIIAAAGSGKTTYLIDEALRTNGNNLLITTFTETNEHAIKEKIVSKRGCIPTNVTVQTWFSFLLQHGVRPFQKAMHNDIHNVDIGFCFVSEQSGKKMDRNLKPILYNGHPLYWSEADFNKHYFTNRFKIYSDKISKFVVESNRKTEGAIVDRISRIFTHIYIDEVQDLAGYDLELLKLFFKSRMDVLLVGDPRQVTYTTHFSRKYKKYSEGGIVGFATNELGQKVTCSIDQITLGRSHRNCSSICRYASKLYPNLSRSVSCNCSSCRSDSGAHEGIYFVREKDIFNYLRFYDATQLRWNSTVKCESKYSARNFGESKGLSFDRVLIYPTRGMLSWIQDNNFDLKFEARAKFYVGITRARYSVGIVVKEKEAAKLANVSDVKLWDKDMIFSSESRWR